MAEAGKQRHLTGSEDSRHVRAIDRSAALVPLCREWIAWARTPNHDAFWAYRDFLLEFIGRGNSDALDVGCGEGRVSRELKALGYKVTACDPTAEFIEAAKAARTKKIPKS